MIRDIPKYPPLLRRTYKAICVCCEEITTVNNKKRIGGLCESCSSNLKKQLSTITIQKAYRKKYY